MGAGQQLRLRVCGRGGAAQDGSGGLKCLDGWRRSHGMGLPKTGDRRRSCNMHSGTG